MITSMMNSQIRNLLQLMEKGKARKKQDLFVVEGIRMFREIPRERIEKVYLAESFHLSPEDGTLEGIPAEVVSDSVFKQLSDTVTPQGILCLVKQFHYCEEDLIREANPTICVLENLQDPGNLGTILRTGEGAGITGILLNKGCVDIYNPKTVRATMGAIFRVPFYYTDDLTASILALKSAHIPVFAAHLKGKAWYDELDYKKGAAFLIGNEGNGLTDETAALADTYLKIPMEGQVESLNASVAASLLMYEAYRQRRT